MNESMFTDHGGTRCHYGPAFGMGDHPAAHRKDGTPVLDHITPQAAGGTDDPSNLVPVCTWHNSHKSDRLDWTPEAQEQGGRFLLLGVMADQIEILTKTRVMLSNRYEALLRDGFNPDHPLVEAVRERFNGLRLLEKQFEKDLLLYFKAEFPEYVELVESRRGLGVKMAARILGQTGDPATRTIGQYFRYCGVAGPHGRKVKGEKLGFNPKVKPAIAAAKPALLTSSSSYRQFYDEGRERYAEREASGEITKGHASNMAFRLVMRAILRDIWITAQGGQATGNTTPELCSSAA